MSRVGYRLYDRWYVVRSFVEYDEQEGNKIKMKEKGGKKNGI